MGWSSSTAVPEGVYRVLEILKEAMGLHGIAQSWSVPAVLVLLSVEVVK